MKIEEKIQTWKIEEETEFLREIIKQKDIEIQNLTAINANLRLRLDRIEDFDGLYSPTQTPRD